MNTSIILGVLGVWQIALIVLVILVIFGGKKIPELMRGIGKGFREFKKGMKDEEDKKDDSSGTES